MYIVSSRAKQGSLKKSRGFAGYDWMIDSIVKHEKITGQKPTTEGTI